MRVRCTSGASASTVGAHPHGLRIPVEPTEVVSTERQINHRLVEWERWPGVAFPNLKNGTALAAAFVSDVRNLVQSFEKQSDEIKEIKCAAA